MVKLKIKPDAKKKNSKLGNTQTQGKRGRWTKEEDAILLKYVKENVGNLSLAFKLTSSEIGRSSLACSARWYIYVSKGSGKDAVAFMCVSKTKIGRNRKNINSDVDSQSKTNWGAIWDKIINLFK